MTPTPQQDVTAVIVNYGSRKDTVELTGTLEDQVSHVIIVDNSNDFERDAVWQDTLPNTTLLSPNANLGFGAAVNLATQRVSTRWLLVLNPDVRLKRNCLKHLLDASRQLHAPLCGPRFYWDDACTLQLPPALGHVLWLCSDRHSPDINLSNQIDLGELSIARHKRFWRQRSSFSEPVLSGACLLFDLHWFQRHNTPLFDEDFFLYYEDTDLCGRLLRKGVTPLCVPEASAVHYWNQASEPPEGKAALMQASEKIFMARYYPNGAPPLPPRKPAPAVTDLGELAAPPALVLPEATCHVDIGVQDDFIMFARTRPKDGRFTFTDNMWSRLRPGRYYCRAIDSQDRGLHYWCWQKTA